MSCPQFRMPPTWTAFALVLAVGMGACGDREGNRPQATSEEAVPDTAATATQPADTVVSHVPGPDTVQGAVVANRPDTTSVAGTGVPAGGNAAASTDTAVAAAGASIDSAHPFMPVTITLEIPPAPIRPRVLRGVRVGRHQGFERIVFEMAGDTLPGYRITYVDPPVVACGSGRQVSLTGKAVLLVRLEPAQAHDDAGHPTIEERRRKPGFATLREMALTCDFEGQVQWALGLDRRVPFRVLKLEDPARLVLDLQEGSS
jgi:hypothetical protein